MALTKISWARFTMNWWHGCMKVSAACARCYAESTDKRWGGGHWGPGSKRRLMSDTYWAQPLAWNRAAAAAGELHTVFSLSMGDWAEDHPDVVQARERGWDMVARTQNLLWLLLTKRPENAGRFVPWGLHGVTPAQYLAGERTSSGYAQPWPNAWGGVTGEDQEWADRRLSKLLGYREEEPTTEWAGTFLSYEPALGPLSLSGPAARRDWLRPQTYYATETWDDDAVGPRDVTCAVKRVRPALSWVIAGDESGTGRRDADIAWVRAVRDEAAAAGTMFHFKQWCGGDVDGVGGDRMKGKIHLPILDGTAHDARP